MQGSLRGLLYSFLLFLFLLQATQGFANLSKTDYAPANHPNFALMDSNSHSAQVQYSMEADTLYKRKDQTIYFGIPVGVDYQLTIESWVFSTYSRNKYVGISSSQEYKKQEDFDLDRNLLYDSIQQKRYSFQEVDVISITVPGVVNAQTQGAVRDKMGVDSLVFSIAWDDFQSEVISPPPRKDTGYSNLFRAFLINGEDALTFRTKRTLPTEEKDKGFHPLSIGYAAEGELVNAAKVSIQPREDALRFYVRESGVTMLPARDLMRIKFDLSKIDLEQVRIWHKGNEVPCLIQEDGDGVFEKGERIIFYGEESTSLYNASSSYWLTWMPLNTPRKTIDEVPVQSTADGIEQYVAHKVINEENDLVQKRVGYFDWSYMQVDTKTKPIPVTCPNILPDGDVTVNLSLFNKTFSSSSFDVWIGDTTAHYSLLINAATTIQFKAPASNFVKDATVYITMDKKPRAVQYKYGSGDKARDEPYLIVDSVEWYYTASPVVGEEPLFIERDGIPNGASSLTLQSEYDLQDCSIWVIKENQILHRLYFENQDDSIAMKIPEGDWDRLEIFPNVEIPEIERAAYDYPSSLHRVDQGYDYIIIAYHTLLEPAQALAKWREANGYNVLLVDVQDIYDEFNYGYADPNAIVRFLRYAQSEWQGLSPEYVVLAGDSSWDHRDREGTGCVDQIPTYTPPQDPQRFGEDGYYSFLWGDISDPFSDVIIGRISVRTPGEFTDYFSKLVAYETETPVGPWKTRNVIITDDTFERYGQKAAEGSFPAQVVSRHINQVDFPHYTNPHLHFMFRGSPDPSVQEYLNKKHSPDCTLEIIDAFDESALFMQYIGHGGNQIWSHERIFYGTDRPNSNILEFQPNTKFPFLLNWSCLTGFLNFNIPPFNVCLAEEFLRYPDRGAIGIWAPSGGASTEYHMVMMHLIARGLLEDNLTRLGEVTTATRIEFLEQKNPPDYIRQYNYFGDPAVQLQTPQEVDSLDVYPKTFAAGKLQRFVVRSSSDLVRSGTAIVSMSANGDVIYESQPLSVTVGYLEHDFTVTVGDSNTDAAKIRVYMWDEKKNVDAWGGVELLPYKPELVLRDGKIEWIDEAAKIEFQVHNNSPFETKDIQGKLVVGHTAFALPAKDIPSGATTTFTWKGLVPADTYQAYASIKDNPETNLPETPIDNRLQIPIRPDIHNKIIPLKQFFNFIQDDLIEYNVAQVQIPVLNLSSDLTQSATVSIINPSDTVVTNTITLLPEQKRTLRFSVPLPEEGNYMFKLRVEQNAFDDTYYFPVKVSGQPDLTFVEDAYISKPDRPMVGRTVSFQLAIKNQGTGPASNIWIEAFDAESTNTKKLNNFNHSSVPRIARLEPGETAVVQLLWDPVEFEGEGEHTIAFAVDSVGRIQETREDNNRMLRTVTLHGLPDLAVDPMVNHYMKLPDEDEEYQLWGAPMRITARVRNEGKSDAEYVRLSVMHNGVESNHIFDKIVRGNDAETRFNVPLVSSKNELMIHVDKYNLIGEISDIEGINNNLSYNKRLYSKIRFPLAPVDNGLRRYHVRNETQFSAGLGEFVFYDPRSRALEMNRNLSLIELPIIPEHVQNETSFTFGMSRYKWNWSAKYNMFISPTEHAMPLKLRVPAPQGRFKVYANLYASSYAEEQPSKVLYKTNEEDTFTTLEHVGSGTDREFHFLGTYDIQDDWFELQWQNIPGESSTSISQMRFVAEEGTPAFATGYYSPILPATENGVSLAIISWDAWVPRKTDLMFKARWVNKVGPSYKYGAWTEMVPAQNDRLELHGKGDFVQFYAKLLRHSKKPISPELRSVTVEIPVGKTRS